MAETRYCVHCGAVTEWREIEGRRRRVCPACGYIDYENPIVAAGAVVEKDECVLLIRRGVEPGRGQWGLPAGYAEIGESPEETAIRETEEETGLQVEIDSLLGVYPFGQLAARSGVVVLYASHPVGGEMKAGDDAIEVAFFSANALPDAIAFPIHRRILADWAKSHCTTYRQATESDLQALQHLIAVAEPECVNTADALRQESVVLALQQGHIVGYASISCIEPAVCMLTRWYVLPAWRRWGIGHRLLDMATQLAERRGVASLQVLLATNNSQSLATLLRQGFVISSLQKAQATDQVIVHLNLSTPEAQADTVPNGETT